MKDENTPISAAFLPHFAKWLLLSAITAALLCGGVALRNWMYSATDSYRFTTDIGNAWSQGAAVLADARVLQGNNEPTHWRSFWRAYLNRYDAALAGARPGRMVLDYPPARLLLVSLWVWHEAGDTATAPHFLRWLAQAPQPHERAGPLLMLNTLFCLAGAVAAFLIVRHALGRLQNEQSVPTFGNRNSAFGNSSTFLALLAATLLWFNPAMLLDSHVWPQWDVWVLPFYLFAAYFGLTRRWILTGTCLGLGAMFKGQVLCTMAVFVLWPLFQLRWRAVLEVAAGVLLGAMLIAWPWMLRTAWAWVFFMALVLLIGGGAYFVPRKWRVLLVCGTVPPALLLSGWTFGGSFGWWNLGIAYGSYHYMRLFLGRPSNLASLLAMRYGWEIRDTVIGNLDLRTLLVGIYAATLTLCAYGLARHDSRGDRRVLIALAAPWALMFAFLPQMHERYFVWAAATTALAAGVSLGATLLHIVITLLASLPILHTILPKGSDHPAWLYQFVNGTHPDAAWAVMLLAVVMLYLALSPSPRRGEGRGEGRSVNPPDTGPCLESPQSPLATAPPADAIE